MRKIDEIIIHCTATEEGKDFKAADIDKWHKARGWKGIGYHYVIDLDGTIEAGRAVEEVGAHCSGHNAHSIGLVYVGGLRNGKPADTRTDMQKRCMWQLVALLLKEHPSITKISGHREYANKACPCFDVRKEFEGWI